MNDVFALDKQYICSTYNRAPVCFTGGEGSFLYDAEGREYIDFACGIAVTGLGHKNRKWIEAVTAQAAALAHTSNLYYSEPCAELASKLCLKTRLSKVFFCNSGAEANECAIKAARKFAFERRGIKHPQIITLKNSFHGRTLASLTATGQDQIHKDCFAPYPDGFTYIDAGNVGQLKSLPENAAAIIIELVQGEGGVIPLEADYVREVEKFCRENGVLLIVDEVQTGNGRCGSLYAYMRYGIAPDIVTTAKGLGNGLPIGATMFSEKTADVLGRGDHGSTFGGNPIACAGACAVLDQLDEKLLDGVVERENYLIGRLTECKGVRGITGLGLMLGIDVGGHADEIAAKCIEKGLVVLTAHGKIRLLPPLNIALSELERGCDILTEVLNETLS